MGTEENTERVLAVCEQCGVGYAAERWPDGEVRVIGRDGCDCGSTDFLVATGCGDDEITVDARAD